MSEFENIETIQKKYLNNDLYLVVVGDENNFYADVNGNLETIFLQNPNNKISKITEECKNVDFKVPGKLDCTKMVVLEKSYSFKPTPVKVYKYYPSNMDGRNRFFDILEEDMENHSPMYAGKGRRVRKTMKSRNNKKKMHKGGKTRMNKSKLSSSMKHFEREITVAFLEILLMVKLFHWKTYSYATHKATDELYSKLNEHMDSFIEVLLGKTGSRIDLSSHKSIKLMDLSSPDSLKREIEAFKGYLVSLNDNKAMKTMLNSDLYNIRDEILGDMNQFLYLLTFK